MKELLARLTALNAPAGREETVREALRQELLGLVDEVEVDTLGNLIAHKRGAGPKLMLAAHMDEIGVIVSEIDEHGFLRFMAVGVPPAGWQLTGERVVFADGVTGVIGKEKVDEVKETKYSRLFIDIGARSREEASARVKVGSLACFTRCFADLGSRVVSKALDDRIGCALLIELARHLGSLPAPLAFDLYLVFTTQEEVGERGATTAAFRIAPDLAVALDVTPAFDTPEPASHSVIALGGGPAIKVMDRGLIVNPKVKDWMCATAEAAGLPYQLEVLESGATDGKTISVSREGVPTGVLSIPCRYVHTPSEMIDWQDAEQSAQLLRHLVSTGYDGNSR